METLNKLSPDYVKNTKNSYFMQTKKRLSNMIISMNNHQANDALDFDLYELKQNCKENSNHSQLRGLRFDLDMYFKNLNHYVSEKLIIFQKKYYELSDGLYILIKGKVCYVWNNKLQDKQKKQNLFNAAKSGIFSLPSDPYLQRPQQYSILLDNPMTIIECQYQNCLVIQDSILLKIEQQTRKSTKFDQLYKERCDLVQNSHLNQFHQTKGTEENRIFDLNMKLHNSFKKYKYFFHHPIQINTLGIVYSGTLKPIKNQGGNKFFQLQRYAIILPGVKYEVISTQAQIMTIQKNQGLTYFHPELVNAYLITKERNTKPFSSGHRYREGFKRTKGSKSLANKSESDITCCMKRWQINKRKKLLTNITKTYSNQVIIPMASCKQTLQFSQKQMQIVKKQMNNTLQLKRYKKPKILFDYSNLNLKPYQSLHAVLQQVQNKNRNYLSKKRQIMQKAKRQRKTFNQREHYLDRYEHISKQLYTKFMHSKTFYENKQRSHNIKN